MTAAALASDTGAPLLRIESCEVPSYHLSDRIQPHAVFAAVCPDTFGVHRISANAASVLGLGIEALIGSDFRTFLTQATADLLSERAASLREERISLSLAFSRGRALASDAFLYRAGGWLCIEFGIPCPALWEESVTTALPRFLELLEHISQAKNAHDDLVRVACEALQEVTGLDRVYYCVFDPDGHGHVCGESRNDRLPALLDHHFPATDIPRAARRMFVRNPFRLIPDIDASPVPILGGDGAVLDLTLSSCRAVAASHLAYLRNMGVTASLSFPLARDGKLVALFGGHHASAHRPSFRQMMLGRYLVDLFIARSDYLLVREASLKLTEQTELLFALSGAYQATDGNLVAFVAGQHLAFSGLMDADDLICRFDGQSHLGTTLNHEDAAGLLDFLGNALKGGETFQTDRLGLAEQRLAALCPAVAGVFAVSLDLSGGAVIAWLRRETVVTERWSGDPRASAVVDSSGEVSPRDSFAAWQRQVKGTCRPWQDVCGAIAKQIRHSFAQVLLSHYESRLRAEAERSNALKSEFVANISHELRSPMHAILGFAEVMTGAGADLPADKRRRHARAILDSGRRLMRLIDDLLDLSRLEAGAMRFAIRDADIRPVIDAAINDLQSTLSASAISVAVLDRRQTPNAAFDPLRMGQVVTNLLSNAIKFSAPGTGVAIALTNATSGLGDVLRIEVADHGAGIPESELQAVFEKFVQSSRTKSNAGGTGLGLAICRDMVAAQHGRIWAENNQDGGASLFVEVPVVQAA